MNGPGALQQPKGKTIQGPPELAESGILPPVLAAPKWTHITAEWTDQTGGVSVESQVRDACG